jgi:hypothetical protein
VTAVWPSFVDTSMLVEAGDLPAERVLGVRTTAADVVEEIFTAATARRLLRTHRRVGLQAKAMVGSSRWRRTPSPGPPSGSSGAEHSLGTRSSADRPKLVRVLVF